MAYRNSKKNKSFLLKLLFCFLSGSLCTLAIVPNSMFIFLILFSISIYVIFKSKRLFEIFLLSYLFSFGWFFFGLFWIGNAFLVKSFIYYLILPFAIILLPLILSIFWALAFCLSKKISEYFGHKYLWFVFFFSLFEFVRGYLLDFPWLMPGNILSSNDYFLQGFALFGTYSMTLVFISLLLIPLFLIEIINGFYLVNSLVIFPIFFIFYLCYERYENKPPNNFNEDYQISIIQPNIKQNIKWMKKNKNIHHDNLVKLSIESQKKQKSNLIIWPETAFLGLFPRDIVILKNLSKKILFSKKSFLLTGSISKNKKKFYNSAILMNSDSKVLNIYNKNTLVPFGEFIPFRNFFFFIPSFAGGIDFSKGKNVNSILVNDTIKIFPLICYEIIFSHKIRNNLSDDISLIVNITNDAWFGDSNGPYQHLEFAKIRAVELGVPIVRIANTGISGYYSPYGELISKINLNKRGYMNVSLIRKNGKTPFKIYGNITLFYFLCYILILNLLEYLRLRKKSL